MEPYQRAAQATRQSGEKPYELAKGAISGSISRILPFLSTYVPVKLAMSGLNKIDPKWGKFFNEANELGYDADEVRDFLKDKISKEQEKKTEQPKENRNIIEQYSPELHQFIDQEVRKGRPLIQAGALAQNDKRFADIINKMQKDHKTPWSNIIQSIYGGALQEQPQDQGQMQQPQQGGGQGDIDPALQQLIQQGNSILQKFKGG